MFLAGFASADQESVLPALTITATQSERQNFEVPQAVSTTSREFIENSLQAVTPDLFRYTPGVYIQKTNQGGGSPFIRGLTGKQVLILVDGVRLNNSYYRFGPHQYLNTIDPNIIERIETVRGPSSVLYGTDALGGVINIITRKRADFSKSLGYDGLLSAHYQSAADAGVFRGQMEGNWDQLGVIAGATGKMFDDLNGGGNLGKQVPSAYDEANADLKLNYRLDENQELIMAGQYTRQYDVPKTSEVTLGDKSKFNYEPQERSLAYLEYRARKLGVFDGVRFNASYNNQVEGEQIIARKTPAIETQELTDVDTAGFLLQFQNLVFDRHNLTYGADYYHDDYRTRLNQIKRSTASVKPLKPGTPNGATYQSWALYLQDEARLINDLEGVFGIRYNQYEARGEVSGNRLDFETEAVAGSVNLSYRLTPHLNLVGGLGFAFRAPNMEDFFGRVDFFSEIPNTSLKPEESFNKEIGLKFRNDSLSGEVFYYNTDYEGFIDRATVGKLPNGNPIKQRQNIADANIEGVEAGAEYWPDKHWLIGAVLNWTEGRDAGTNAPLRRIPPLNGSARIVYYPINRLWIEGNIWWADNQNLLSAADIEDPRIGPGGTPGYTVYGIKAGYTPHPQHELLVGLENLSDKKYKTHGSGIYAPGLNVMATYRFKF